MDFSKLLQDNNAYTDFKNNYMRGNIGQAYLFTCPDRLTASEFVLEIAKLLLCENSCGCGVCANCKKINAKTHPDVLIYPKDKAFMVDDAGDIYNKVQIKPMLANIKVFIINQIDNSTEQAQNKILKIIEEPPENVIFLMTATNQNKVLPTILSRVSKQEIGKINTEDIQKIISDDGEIAKIASICGDGYLGKTLSIINDSGFVDDYKNMLNMLKNMKKSEQIPQFNAYFSKNKQIFENSLMLLGDFYRDMLMIKLGCAKLVKHTNLIGDYNTIVTEYSNMALVNIIRDLNEAKQKMDSNVNLITLTDNMLLKILEVKFLCK